MTMLRDEYNSVVPDNMEDLLKLPGVGRKSANLILGDIYGQPAIVADTHCIRLSNRIGFMKKNDKSSTDPVKVEMQLKKVIAPEKQNDFCHRLVEHGRAVCTARKPYCEKCVLSRVCDYKINMDKQAKKANKTGEKAGKYISCLFIIYEKISKSLSILSGEYSISAEKIRHISAMASTENSL